VRTTSGSARAPSMTPGFFESHESRGRALRNAVRSAARPELVRRHPPPVSVDVPHRERLEREVALAHERPRVRLLKPALELGRVAEATGKEARNHAGEGFVVARVQMQSWGRCDGGHDVGLAFAARPYPTGSFRPAS
jgi:hypothetical protein